MTIELPEPIRIEICGTPQPQPRPRFVKGHVVSTIAPRVKRYHLLTQQACVEAAMAVGESTVELMAEHPLRLTIELRFGVAEKNRHWIGLPHWHKCDIDNACKLLMDQMMKAGLIKDDAWVAELIARKVWVDPRKAGATIVMEALPKPEIGRGAPEARAERPTWLSEGVGR